MPGPTTTYVQPTAPYWSPLEYADNDVCPNGFRDVDGNCSNCSNGSYPSEDGLRCVVAGVGSVKGPPVVQ